MKLFTVGPVEMYQETLDIEGKQQPYFRTPEFSLVMKEIERNFLGSLHAPAETSFIGLTCSGTGAMDAVVMNTLNSSDKALVINGGSFGNRFAQICKRYDIPTDTYDIPFQSSFTVETFEKYSDKGYTVLLVNACETSTGQKYDLKSLGDFCKRNHMFFIVDAVSAYLADPINMAKDGIDVLLTASQKALALAPGVSLVALSSKARARVEYSKSCYYFDFKSYIENQRRGQPPFTCSVGTMLALCKRLESIMREGVAKINAEHARRAGHFRELVKQLPLTIPDIPLSNSCTPILFPKQNATEIYEALRRKHGLVLTPSGGDWKDKQLRVGHLGNLTLEDYDRLVNELREELI